MANELLEETLFDLDAILASDGDLIVTPSRLSKRPPRHRRGEMFLQGPIPWNWLDRAGRLQGRTLHVALLLWRESGLRKNREVRFRLTAENFGMHSSTARRALRALSEDGLVSVQSPPRSVLRVPLLDAAPRHSSSVTAEKRI